MTGRTTMMLTPTSTLTGRKRQSRSAVATRRETQMELKEKEIPTR